VTQGITTEVTGEGASAAPIDERQLAEGKDTWKRYGLRPSWRTLAGYFEAFRKAPPTINVGTFVGLGGLRDLVIGSADRRLTPGELARMVAEVEKGMREGALGVSNSLQYVPDIYFSTEEIVPLARAAGRLGGKWFVHQRSEGNRIEASLEELFRVAREAGVPADIWHLKAAYRRNWGRMPEILAKIEAARAAGLDVAASAYPWAAAANGVDACLPPWVREGGREKLLERLRDPATREKAKRDMADEGTGWENQWYGAGGAKGVLLSSVLDPRLKPLEGKTFEEIGLAQGKDPRDALIDVVLADRANSGGIVFIMSEDDVRAALRHPLVAFCTDSPAVAPDGILSEEGSHPRAWGSAPRILGKYVRDERLLPLEEAVRKMTSLPAARAGIPDRGLVKEGMAADLVAFDPRTVRERSTYADPHRASEGIPYVAVNGELVVDGGTVTAARPGRPVLGPATLR
jgi:dihydroorotase/N-acyl-D-amino-acid deacylase